ncbi:MAG: Crp/Fnr family transcriptional regulator, partial [Chitinispirillaceae bacterium]|nr:Crp/Fnr family transcriptional regulator [Chitinispirillaceae bacterium]
MPEQKQENSRIVKLKKTQVLFRENDDSQDLFIVRSGSLKIVRKHQGREVVLDTLTTGMVAGEITSIDNSKRTATAIADSETELIKIPKDEFKVIYEKIPDWFRKIATILVQRLRAVDEKICRAMSMDHTRHVAAGISLLSYSDRCVQNTEGYEFDQRFLEGELSDMLSIPPAEVQGAIEALVGKKVLACAGGKIVLADRITCEQLCAEL